ncbi:Sec-independent protein translocase TatB [Cellulomonas oligotrophica]|uniref:Translocase n=1 Tax=Cellulomonas oligotrophica TaxID=931536 RepID=A0A7Y9K071_9CELL|nr:Sec-independent protein translocase TatB [Cellulomonas oligotrophica]NYD87559.1 sec-independent protein translocase protein TatB [Cellulomonas oligotrophica]GIG33436.1 translocase [Cellulomonas oligotrophica]
MFGINGGELLVLLLVAALVVGPERLPAYAEQLAGWVRRLRDVARDARSRIDDELGDTAADVDWAALDPRRYDPRRIVRDALLEDTAPTRSRPSVPRPGRAAATAATGAATAGARATVRDDAPAPYDDEAT